MMSLKDHKDTWATLGSIVQISAIIAGGSFAVYKYIDAERAQRTKETLVYVDRYQKSPLHDVRMELEGVWMRYEDALRAKVELHAKQEISDQEFTQFVLDVIHNEELEQAIIARLNFFESVLACTQSKVCDENAAKSFFCSDAMEFFYLHYRFIASVRTRRNDPRWAQSLEKFAKTTCGG
jgi:hypothetical protein